MSALRPAAPLAVAPLGCVVAAALCVAVGCTPSRSPPDPRLPLDLGPDEEWIYGTHPELPLDAVEVRALAASVVDATADFRVVSASVDDARAKGRMLVRVEEVTAGESFHVRALVRLTLPSGTTWQSQGTGRGDAAEALRDAVRDGLSEALWESRVEHLTDEALVAALASVSPRRRALATARLAARRHPAVFASLVEALGDDCRTEPSSAALGGLAALGDRRAVPAVVDAMERCVDPTFQLQATFALGTLGGDLAEAYLFTLSAGHADPRLREAAREAHALLLRQTPRDGGVGDVP